MASRGIPFRNRFPGGLLLWNCANRGQAQLCLKIGCPWRTLPVVLDAAYQSVEWPRQCMRSLGFARDFGSRLPLRSRLLDTSSSTPSFSADLSTQGFEFAISKLIGGVPTGNRQAPVDYRGFSVSDLKIPTLSRDSQRFPRHAKAAGHPIRSRFLRKGGEVFPALYWPYPCPPISKKKRPRKPSTSKLSAAR